MSDKIIKQARVLGPVADFMGFLGGIIQIAAIHSPAPEVRDYAKFQTEMESYLSKIFTSTEKLLHETIVAVFGEGAGDKENDPQKIKDVLKVMSSKGRTDIDYNSKQPVAELLKGGAMMVPVQQSEIGKSIDEAIEILVSIAVSLRNQQQKELTKRSNTVSLVDTSPVCVSTSNTLSRTTRPRTRTFPNVVARVHTISMASATSSDALSLARRATTDDRNLKTSTSMPWRSTVLTSKSSWRTLSSATTVS